MKVKLETHLNIITFVISGLAAVCWIIMFVGLFFGLKPISFDIDLAYLLTAYGFISLTFRTAKDVFK